MIGLGIAALGFGARFVLRTIPAMGQRMAEAATSMPKLDGEVSMGYSMPNIGVRKMRVILCG